MRKKGQLAPIFLLIFICSGVFVFGAMAKKTATIDKLTYKSVSQSLYDTEEYVGGDGYNFDIYAQITENDDEHETTETKNVTTSYYGGGYYSFLKVDDAEKYVSFDSINEEEILEQNKLNDVQINISAEEETDTKVVVTYRIENESSANKTISIASATDVAVGNYDNYDYNDNAAILRKNGKQGFKITQDNSNIFGFGSSFDIELSPFATTTWIGDYYDNFGVGYLDKRHTQGDIEELTIMDGVDSALAYSWNYDLAVGETKEFTATFIIGIAELKEVEFYKLNNDESGYDQEPIIINAVLGGALQTPETKKSDEPGYNYKWSENEDGTGRKVNGLTYMVHDNATGKYYENKYLNDIVIKNNKTNDVLRTEIELIGEDPELEELIQNSYGDVELDPYWYVINDTEEMEELEKELKEGDYISESEKVIQTQEFYVELCTYNKYEDEDDVYYDEDCDSYEKELEVSFEIPQDERNNYNTFKMMKEVYECPEDEGECIYTLVEVESEYNPVTGRISFKAKNDDFYILIGEAVMFSPEIQMEDKVIESVVGENAKAEIYLKDPNGYPLIGVKAKYEFDDKVYEVESNEEGKIVVEIKSDNEGEFSIKLVTAESKFLQSAEKTIIFNFKAKEPEPTCETNPEMEGCKEPEPTCETNPEMEGCKKEEEPIPDAPETGQNSESDDSIKQAVLITVIISSISALFITMKRTINDKKSPYKTVK